MEQNIAINLLYYYFRFMYPKNTQQSKERENSRRGKNQVVAGDDDRPEQVAKET